LRRKRFVTLLGAAPLLAAAPVLGAGRSGVVRDRQFVVNGKPLQIICGELHYSRIPREYWRHRLQMAKAMGLNAIGTYVFWNMHEPQRGTYDFTGAQDVAHFIRLAQEEGLYVVLRPGPYACAEWEFGGFPAWLAADASVQLRSRDPRFLDPARAFLKRLGEQLALLQNAHGGPIILVQVENEYGSFGDDRAYVEEIRNALLDAGFTGAMLRTEDGAAEMAAGSLPGLVIGVSAGDVRDDLKRLENFRPGNPFFEGEYYPGWFDHWGEAHHEVPASESADDLAWILSQGGSFSLYMFHGGTTFGFMNGANYSSSEPFQPTTTSYDYDAPVSEGGSVTPKFHTFRNIIARHTGKTPPAIPPLPRRITIPEFELAQHADMRALLVTPVRDERPKHMEAYGQAYGMILYRTKLDSPVNGELRFGDVRDFAVICVDDNRIGELDRRKEERSIAIRTSGSATLSILVENCGRLNYGRKFIHDVKGIIGPVKIGERELLNWDVYTIPLQTLSGLRFNQRDLGGRPAFHRGTFTLDRTGDTFFDTRTLGKGNLWINGHNAGRFWSIGPQYTLYVPASWLRMGQNEAIIYDLYSREVRTLSGRTTPLWAPIA
jgi:beta-galactosidase